MTPAKPLFLAGFFLSIAWAGSAVAHVELSYPMPRALGKTEGNLKNTPCGQSTDGRTQDRVTVFAPGQTITLQFDEFIDHPAYYRVAFDPDGDDFPMRTGVAANTVETTAQAQAAEQAVFQGSGSQLLAVVPEVNGSASSATVTLPDTECENCTLQLIEFMYDKGDPNHGYFQCADIALREGAAGGDESGAAPDAGAPPATSGGLGNGTQVAPAPTGGETAAGVGVGTGTSVPSTNGGKGSAMPTATATGSPAPSSAAATGSSTTPTANAQPQSMDSGGGCALSPVGNATAEGGLAGLACLSILGLGITARRRRR
jgi:hypothetical protein